MLIQVLDDRLSLIHLLCGVLSYFWLFVFIIFIFYEIVEHIYKYRKEKESCFLGDIAEFAIGYSAVGLSFQALSGF